MADKNPITGASTPVEEVDDGKGTTPAPPPSAAAHPPPAPPSRSSSPYVSDGSRKFSSPYTPQFSPATQMILKRMRGESGGLSSALASATAPDAPRPNFPRPVYESVRERIVASMTSGNTMSLPAPPSSSSSITASTLRFSVKPVLTSGSIGRPPVAGGQKRKRPHIDGDTSDVSSPAEGSDYGEGIKKTKPKQAATPQITQSGRRILKPDTYDPAAEDNAKKNARLGKRTTEQALCKRCTRMHSPATNQMVFCDGCNDPWHQRCHDPWIEDEIIKDQSLKWYCLICQAKRERLQPKKKVEPPRFGSWADRPASQKRAYLSALSPEDLVNLLLHATELHPDLPIFPIESTSSPKKSSASSMARSLFAGASAGGLFHRAEANPTGPMNFIRKIPANAKKSTLAKARSGTGSLQSKTAAQASALAAGNQVYDEEESSFTRLWPRPGKGMYSRLPPEADDDRGLTDDNDHAAFSVIIFNEKGSDRFADFADEYANRENRREWGQGVEGYHEDHVENHTNSLIHGQRSNPKHVTAAAAKWTKPGKKFNKTTKGHGLDSSGAVSTSGAPPISNVSSDKTVLVLLLVSALTVLLSGLAAGAACDDDSPDVDDPLRLIASICALFFSPE